MYVGVIVRLVLGATLIVVAPNSLLPLVSQTLGWTAVFAALALAVMGRKPTRKLMVWFKQLAMPMIRLWLLFGMAFVGLLVYSNLPATCQSF
jgi:hypothetical protein